MKSWLLSKIFPNHISHSAYRKRTVRLIPCHLQNVGFSSADSLRENTGTMSGFAWPPPKGLALRTLTLQWSPPTWSFPIVFRVSLLITSRHPGTIQVWEVKWDNMKHSRDAKHNSKEEFKGKRQYRKQGKNSKILRDIKFVASRKKKRVLPQRHSDHIKEFLEMFNMLYVYIFLCSLCYIC